MRPLSWMQQGWKAQNERAPVRIVRPSDVVDPPKPPRQFTCRACGHQWVRNVKRPNRCPECQSTTLSGRRLVKHEPRGGRSRYASVGQRLKILERDRYACRWCGAKLTNETANMDHVFPYKFHGNTTLKNMVTCCRFCNKAKMNNTQMKHLLPPVGKPTDPFNRWSAESTPGGVLQQSRGGQ